MGPIHSIDLREINDKCFASTHNGGCLVTVMEGVKCGHHCPFYKPKGASDWVRVGNHLIPPEDYKQIRGGKK